MSTGCDPFGSFQSVFGTTEVPPVLSTHNPEYEPIGVARAQAAARAMRRSATGKRCKCGSIHHSRTNHRRCPLRNVRRRRVDVSTAVAATTTTTVVPTAATATAVSSVTAPKVSRPKRKRKKTSTPVDTASTSSESEMNMSSSSSSDSDSDSEDRILSSIRKRLQKYSCWFKTY